MKIVFYSIHNFEREFLTRANKEGHELLLLGARLDRQTVELAAGADAICIFVNDDASTPIVERLAAMGVQYVALRSAGFNQIDLKRAGELGISVANVPEYSPYAVAEHTVALILALNRRIARAHNRVREMNFSLDGLVGFDLHGKTVGLVGLGRIGAVVARIMHGFGCKLLGHDPNMAPELERDLGVRSVDLPTLFAESDIISLHAPLMAATRHMVGAEAISRMKNGVMLINTSRGALIDTPAVIQALKSGQIGFLGLDVYEEEAALFFEDRSEQILQDDVIARLLTFQNVLITSHQGFLTDTALGNIAGTTFLNLNSWAGGERAPHELTGRA